MTSAALPPARARAMSRDEVLAKAERDARGSWVKRFFSHDAALYPISVALALFLWYAVIWIFRVPAYLLPPPHAVVLAAGQSGALLLEQSWVTLVEIVAAFVLSAVIGVPLGILIASFRIVDKLINPLLVLSQGIPKIALAPVVIAWFGFGFRSNLVIGFLIAAFPVVVNTVLGMRSLDRDLPRLGRSLRARRDRMLLVVRLPAALPSILAGLKISATFAAVGAIIGEFAAGSAGLGYLIQVTVGNLNMALGFAAIVCTALVGWLTYAAVEVLEWQLNRTRFGGRS